MNVSLNYAPIQLTGDSGDCPICWDSLNEIGEHGEAVAHPGKGAAHPLHRNCMEKIFTSAIENGAPLTCPNCFDVVGEVSESWKQRVIKNLTGFGDDVCAKLKFLAIPAIASCGVKALMFENGATRYSAAALVSGACVSAVASVLDGEVNLFQGVKVGLEVEVISALARAVSIDMITYSRNTGRSLELSLVLGTFGGYLLGSVAAVACDKLLNRIQRRAN